VLGAGPGFAGLYLIVHQPMPAESLAGRLRRLAGVPAPEPRTRVELADDDLGVLPHPSIRPFALAVGATVALTGLVLGFWLLILGGAIAGVAAVGWQSAVNQEQRHGRLARTFPGSDDRGWPSTDARPPKGAP
jgi:Cytochrome c oxidase subunit IV